MMIRPFGSGRRAVAAFAQRSGTRPAWASGEQLGQPGPGQEGSDCPVARKQPSLFLENLDVEGEGEPPLKQATGGKAPPIDVKGKSDGTSGVSPLSDILALVLRLLRMHEVKLTMQMLEELVSKRIDGGSAGMSEEEMRALLDRFLQHHRHSQVPQSDEGLQEIDGFLAGTWSKQVSAVGKLNDWVLHPNSLFCDPSEEIGKRVIQFDKTLDSPFEKMQYSTLSHVHSKFQETAASFCPAAVVQMDVDKKGLGKNDPYGLFEVNEAWLTEPSNQLVISPNGNFKMVWDFFALLAIVSEAITVPLFLSFDESAPLAVNWLFCIFFLGDIVLSFFTGCYKDGILVMKQRIIAQHYFRTWFLLDFVSTFPWFAIFKDNKDSAGDAGSSLRIVKLGKLIRVLRLLRVAKLRVLLEQFQDLFHSSLMVMGFKMGQIVACLALLTHWIACMWVWIGAPERHHGEFETSDPGHCEPGGPCEPGIAGSAWRRRYGLETDSLPSQYLHALRFATGISTGTDVDVQPGFWAERLYVVLATFGSFIICSTIISRILDMFQKIRQDHVEHEEIMRVFKQFMLTRDVPLSLQTKIRRYLEWQFQARKEIGLHNENNESIFQWLSPWLRKELQVVLFKRHLELHPFFRDLPQEMLAHVCCLASTALCAPGDQVIQEGQVVREALFIVRGKLTITSKDGHLEQAVRTTSGADPAPRVSTQQTMANMVRGVGGLVLGAPGYVGAASLFWMPTSRYTVTSSVHCELLKLARQDIEGLSQEFPWLDEHRKRLVLSISQEQDKPWRLDCSLNLEL